MKNMNILLLCSVILSFLEASCATSYDGGSGSQADPYKISIAQHWIQLCDTSADWNYHFILTEDIDLNGVAIRPVGNIGIPFAGSFNGQGHSINNASINLVDQSNLGLFGYLGPGGLIRNLGVKNVRLLGNDHVGGLVGFSNGGTIDSCYATGLIEGGSYIGGIVGSNNQGKVLWCFSTVIILGDELTGGVCGWNNVSLPFVSRGNFWDIETSGILVSSMGMGRTTAQMQTLSTFLVYDWDFTGESINGTTDTWRMCADGVDYPRLSLEFSHMGDFECPDGIGLEDLLCLASRWLANTPETIGSADPNSDNKVDLSDLEYLSKYWLK
ncbi:MAG: hypothetical protein JW828_09045 [Sedimentisphaerales bacterium]|nr:hypothetical protein [Sedimentisphaerales bacterium]